jgi:glycosyltransferase involved in cell wall biosynthesis
VASFTYMKDYQTFMAAAFKILENYPNTVFLCIGEGPDLEKIKKGVPSNYSENIHFLGRRSDVELLVSIFDIGVLTTFTEGISNAIIEYMLMGKPVVATDGGGTKELVIDGSTGFLVQKQSVSDLQHKIELLLTDENLRTTMGTHGKKRILDEFNLAKMTHNYIELYKSILYN